MQRSRRIASAISGTIATVSALVACASLVVPDIDGTTRPDADAGPPLKDAAFDGTPKDPCVHAVPPPKNVSDDPTLDVGTLSFVLRETHLEKTFGYDAGVFGDAGPSPNIALGFDLDNDCTCEPGLPHEAGPNSCAPFPGKMACDLPNGIDNQIPALLAPLKVIAGASDLDDLATINKRIAGGDTANVFIVRGYNGLPNDNELTVEIHSVRRPNRLPYADGGDQCINAGPRPPSFPPLDDPDAADGATYDHDRLPLFDGCDVWGDIVGTTGFPAYVANHVLVVNADVAVPIPFAGAIIDAESLKMTAVLVPDGTGGWTLEDGQLGARGPVNALLTAGGSLSFSKDAGPVCLDTTPSGRAQRTLFIANTCPVVDINLHSSQDFYVSKTTGKEVACDAVSIAFAFRAERGFLGAPADDAGASQANCADTGLTCPAFDSGN